MASRQMLAMLYIHTYVGLSLLLVPTIRAMRRPFYRGASSRTDSTFFLYTLKDFFVKNAVLESVGANLNKMKTPRIYFFVLKACLLSLFVILIHTNASAQNDESVGTNKFVVGKAVATPITVKTSDGTFSIYGGEVIKGDFTYYEATDANGKRLWPEVSHEYKTGQSPMHIYSFTLTYDSQNNEQVDGGEYENVAPDDTEQPMTVKDRPLIDPNDMPHNNYYSDKTVDIVNSIPDFVSAADWSGVHLALGIGASRMFGEFAELRLTSNDENAFVVYGGVGKDWLFKGRNSEKISWFGGIGFMESFDESQFTIGLSFSENAVRADYSLNVDLEYRLYMGESKRFGFFGGLTAGMGNFKEVVTYKEDEEPFPGKFVWDVRLGLAVRI